MCFYNCGLHGCCINRGNISGAKTDMDEMDGTIDMEKVTQFNYSGVGKPLVPFYHQCCYGVLE